MDDFKFNFSYKCEFDFAGDSLKISIETNRLIIRSYNQLDLDYCLSIYSNPRLARFFDNGKPKSTSEIEKLVQERGINNFSSGKPFGLFSIFEKKTNIFLGQLDFLPFNENNDIFEIGCIIDRPFHGRNISQEALYSIVHYYPVDLNKQFSSSIKIRKIIATAHPKNIASHRLIKFLGLSYIKTENRFNSERNWYSIDLLEK